MQIQRMELLPELLRAARVSLGLTQDQLAKLAGISKRSLMRFEAGDENMRILTHRAIERALKKKGIVFLDRDGSLGPGFRLPLNFKSSRHDSNDA